MADEAAWDRGWGEALLRPVAEINEQLLEWLRSTAAAAGSDRGPLPGSLCPEWRRLDGPAIRRLAACPYLLVDGGFDQPQCWGALSGRPGNAGVRDGGPGPGSRTASAYFRDAAGIGVVRLTLMLAWHLAHSHRLAARVLLGMTECTAQLVAAARLQDLLRLAEDGPHWIVPRWEHQPQIWRQLIQAACRDHPAALRAVQLRGMQLLAGNGPHLPRPR